MEFLFWNHRGLLHLLVKIIGLTLLSGCANTVPEKPLPESWGPANAADEFPRVIPLSRHYIYKVLVVDRTLMQLVRRWSKDTQVTNEYGCADDFTLPKKLVGRSFTSLDQGLAEINDTYYLFGAKVILNKKNEFQVECINRDVLTDIVRLPQEMKKIGEGSSSRAVPSESKEE